MQNMPDFRFLFLVDPVVLKKSDVKLSMEWQTIKDYLGMSFYTFIKTGTHSHTHLLAHTHTHRTIRTQTLICNLCHTSKMIMNTQSELNQSVEKLPSKIAEKVVVYSTYHTLSYVCNNLHCNN